MFPFNQSLQFEFSTKHQNLTQNFQQNDITNSKCELGNTILPNEEKQNNTQLDETIHKKRKQMKILYNDENNLMQQDKIQNNEADDALIQQYPICEIYNQNQTKVELLYQSDIQAFTIIKSYLNQTESDFKEIQILQMLKGQNITLDIISDTQYNKSIQQLAGKTNLSILKEKTQCAYLFDLYFFILYDKLNKMHTLNIAHSDIKPQNIVISYDNEPFFIDFDGSVILPQQYQNYLQNQTPRYNLECYINKNKKFTTLKDIKLCDRTQLALTFLSLFCNDQEDRRLFCNKKYNILLQKLYYENKIKNREVALSQISRILNEADKKIYIVGNQLENVFEIDYTKINQELQKSNDIIFIEKENMYKVNRIDQYSINLLYLLDKSNCNLKIDPDKMVIIPQPKSKQYNYVYQKYDKLKIYHQKLINFGFLKSENDINNLCEYIKVLQNTKCCISLNKRQYWNTVLKAIKSQQNIDMVENDIFLYFEEEYYSTFIKSFNKILSDFYISSFEFFQDMIQLQIKRGQSQIKQYVEIQFQGRNSGQLIQLLQKQQNFINEKQNLKQIIIVFQDINEDEYPEIVENLNKNTQQIINSLENIFKHKLKIQFKYKIFYRFNDIYKLQLFKDIKNQLCNKNKKQKKLINKFYDILNQIKQTDQRLNDQNNQLSDPLLTDFKALLCRKGEKQILLTLQNIQKIENVPQKLSITFFNYLFIKTKMWQEFKKLIKEEEINYAIEIKLISCQFSENVVFFLKEMEQNYSQICYESYEYYNKVEWISYQEQDFKIGIEYLPKKELNKIIFKIKFYKQQTEQDQQSNSNNQNEYQVKDQYIFYKDEQESKLKNTEGIQTILGEQQIYKNKIFQELKMDNSSSFDIIKFEQINKETELIKNVERLQSVIQEIKNKIHYKNINILIEKNVFDYNNQLDDINQSINSNIKILYQYNKSKNNLLDSFYQLYLAIVQNQNYLSNTNSIYDFRQDIKIINQFTSFRIEQNLISQSKNATESLEIDDMFEYQIQNYVKSDEKQELIINLNYTFIFKQELEIINNRKFLISTDESIMNYQFFNDLQVFNQNYSIFNSQISDHIFNNKNYIISFSFRLITIKNTFKILLEEIEKLYPQQQKLYNLQECGLTGQALYDIHEIIKEFSKEKRIKFDLKHNNIKYMEFKQFIEKILFDCLIKYYIFEIHCVDDQIRQLIIQEFQEYIQINQTKKFIILNFSECFALNQELNIKSKIKIVLYFNHTHFPKISQQNIQKDSQIINNNQFDKTLQNLNNLDKNHISFIQMLNKSQYLNHQIKNSFESISIDYQNQQNFNPSQVDETEIEGGETEIKDYETETESNESQIENDQIINENNREKKIQLQFNNKVNKYQYLDEQDNENEQVNQSEELNINEEQRGIIVPPPIWNGENHRILKQLDQKEEQFEEQNSFYSYYDDFKPDEQELNEFQKEDIIQFNEEIEKKCSIEFKEEDKKELMNTFNLICYEINQISFHSINCANFLDCTQIKHYNQI